MGLDMYLEGRKYVRGYNVSIKKGKEKAEKIADVKYLITETGYWRKANAIHKWFVDNVQKGEDDCKEYYVSESQLKALLDTVTRVLQASKLIEGKVNNGYTFKDGVKTPIVEDGKFIEDPTVARELLPTAEGFFFGNTDYNEYYYDDLVLTKQIIEKALASTDSQYYSSSW